MSEERDELRNSVFLATALLHSVLGTCDRLRVASVAIKNKRIVGIGFNGSVNGLPHCDDIGHLIIDGHCERTLHSEINLIFNTNKEDLKGAKVLVTATLCLRCAQNLAQAGVVEIHYFGKYSNSLGKEYVEETCKDVGIDLVRHDLDAAELFQEMFDQMTEKGGILQKVRYQLKIFN